MQACIEKRNTAELPGFSLMDGCSSRLRMSWHKSNPVQIGPASRRAGRAQPSITRLHGKRAVRVVFYLLDRSETIRSARWGELPAMLSIVRPVNFFLHSVAKCIDRLCDTCYSMCEGILLSRPYVLVSQADELPGASNQFPLEVRPGHNGVIGLLFCREFTRANQSSPPSR